MKVYYDFETMLVKPDHAELKLEVLRKGRKSINHVLQKLKSTYQQALHRIFVTQKMFN